MAGNAFSIVPNPLVNLPILVDLNASAATLLVLRSICFKVLTVSTAKDEESEVLFCIKSKEFAISFTFSLLPSAPPVTSVNFPLTYLRPVPCVA